MPSNSDSTQDKSARIVIIKGTGPKERPPMPQGLLRPPGANPEQQSVTENSSDSQD